MVQEKQLTAETVEATRVRLEKARKRCKFVGAAYLIGTLALIAALFLDFFTVGESKISALNFYNALILKGVPDLKTIVGILPNVLFALMIMVAVINFIRVCVALGKMKKAKDTPFEKYNHTVKRMGKAAGAFSGTLVTYVVTSMVVCSVCEAKLTFFALCAMGAGVFFHFFAGLIGGKTLWFDEGENGEILESKRNSSLFVFFLRNLIQIACVAGILFFFFKVNVLANAVALIADGKLGDLLSNIWELIIVVLQSLILVALIVLINHALRATEFNGKGMKGKGMKNFRVFSFMVTLFALACFFVAYFYAKVWDFEIAYIAAIALGGFLFDCIIKSKKGRKLLFVYTEEEPVQEAPKTPAYRVPIQCISQPGVFMQPNGRPVMVMPMQYMNVPTAIQATQPVVGGANAMQAANTAQQPAQPAANVQASAPANQAAAAQPAAATTAQPTQPAANVKPTAAPAQNAAVQNGANGGNVNNVAVAPVPVGYNNRPEPQMSPYYFDDLDALTFRWDLNGKERQVACPYCGQKIALTEGAPGYRCFNCGKVFRMEKPKTQN